MTKLLIIAILVLASPVSLAQDYQGRVVDLSRDPLYRMLSGASSEIDILGPEADLKEDPDPFAKFRTEQTATEGPAAPVKLLCDNGMGTRLFIVDYTNKKVNGEAANFTETVIKFSQKAEFGLEAVSIDRYTGRVVAVAKNNTSETVYQGQCRPAPARML